jgi:uncharacterized protein (DUF2225 family)
MKKIIFIFGLFMIITNSITATTWFPAEHICPICKKKNNYQEIGSYGGYIYQWESKYQYIYWPNTDNASVYCCPNCHFSVYMWDFDSIPENKIDTITKLLSTIKLDGDYKDYREIPMTIRLEIAEKIYKILEYNQLYFWCQFYRIMGYHYDENKNINRAKESRLASLNIANQMLTDSVYKGQEKELFFIIAAMHYFTKQKDSALIYLNKASLLTYENKNWKEKNAKGLDEYLTDLIKQYKEFIKKED